MYEKHSIVRCLFRQFESLDSFARIRVVFDSFSFSLSYRIRFRIDRRFRSSRSTCRFDSSIRYRYRCRLGRFVVCVALSFYRSCRSFRVVIVASSYRCRIVRGRCRSSRYSMVVVVSLVSFRSCRMSIVVSMVVVARWSMVDSFRFDSFRLSFLTIKLTACHITQLREGFWARLGREKFRT